jgi:predicted ATPase
MELESGHQRLHRLTKSNKDDNKIHVTVPLRISLTGAQGTGKSTLARAIAERLHSPRREILLHEGIGNAVAGSGLATGALGTAESVRTFVRLHRARDAAPSSAAVQIFDRCLLDAFAYAHVLACLPKRELEELRRATIESCAGLARLIWLRVSHDYPVMTPRDETPEFRRAIDAAIGRLARENAIALIEHALFPDRIDDITAEVQAFVNDCEIRAGSHTAR